MKLRTHPVNVTGRAHPLKPIAEKVNETGTTTSEKVHLGEIAVTLGAAAVPEGELETVRGDAGSLAVPR
jgi:hypothetical protein